MTYLSAHVLDVFQPHEILTVESYKNQLKDITNISSEE